MFTRRRVVAAAATGVLASLAGLGSAAHAGNPPVIPSPTKAGYAASTPSGTVQVTAQFKVPTVTCPPAGTQSFLPGLAWGGPAGVIFAEVTLTCVNGTLQPLTLQGAVQTVGVPALVQVPVAQGDLIKAAEIYSGGVGRVSVADVTSGGTWHKAHATMASAPLSVFAGVSVLGSSSLTPLPKFSRVAFSHLDAYSGSKPPTLTALGAMNPIGFNMVRSGSAGKSILQVATSALSAGTSFTDTWKHS